MFLKGLVILSAAPGDTKDGVCFLGPPQRMSFNEDPGTSVSPKLHSHVCECHCCHLEF